MKAHEFESATFVQNLAVNGPTARGTDFDPDVIAAEFVKLHEGTVTDTEIAFNGAPPLRPDQGSCSTRVTFRSN